MDNFYRFELILIFAHLHSIPSQVVFDSSHAGHSRVIVVVMLVVVSEVIVAPVAAVVVLAKDEAGGVAVSGRRRGKRRSLCKRTSISSVLEPF